MEDINYGMVGKQNLHHHHNVCQMNTSTKIILLHTNNITLARKKDLQSILELTHQTLCVNVIHHEKNNQ